MIGYYQVPHDGTGVNLHEPNGGGQGLRWVSGYRPGCSPDEKRERRNAAARERRTFKRNYPGYKRCLDCHGPTLSDSSAGGDLVGFCDSCRKKREENIARHGREISARRILRLRHGRNFKVTPETIALVLKEISHG